MNNLAVARSRPVKPQILICDDDLEYCQDLIESLGLRGFQASNLLTITKSRASLLAPSILLLDLCMPERSAIDIAKLLADHPRKGCFKIVLITGCSEAIIESVSRQFEMRGLELLGQFQKPVDLDKLCELLQTAMNGRWTPSIRR
jgi:DNA-binding NtrC family response regulator